MSVYTDKKITGSIERKLDEILSKASKAPDILYEAMRYSVFSGGKRIRPVITVEACMACGGKSQAAVAAGCAVELVHTYSLIHDDLPSMDNDDFRRGLPTCHKKFGEAAAILAGDALLTLAFQVISENLKPAVASQVTRELSAAAGSLGMVGGQVLDIEAGPDRKDKKAIERINLLKTAKLFEAAAKIGAIVSLASGKKIGLMARYGLAVGMAFQITDDIIDKEDDASEKEAQKFIAAAKNALLVFGSPAGRLNKIADSIAGRLR